MAHQGWADGSDRSLRTSLSRRHRPRPAAGCASQRVPRWPRRRKSSDPATPDWTRSRPRPRCGCDHCTMQIATYSTDTLTTWSAHNAQSFSIWVFAFVRCIIFAIFVIRVSISLNDCHRYIVLHLPMWTILFYANKLQFRHDCWTD